MPSTEAVRVGHLDTGVDPALASRVERFRTVDRDGLDSRDTVPSDPHGHGTVTAELIIGAAPDAVLCSASVIEDGNIVARILLGLDWLAACGVGVVCLPLGLPSRTPALRSAVRALVERDVVMVAPIGNGGAGAACAPGCYPEVLSVGASRADGRVAAFSGSAHGEDGGCVGPDVVTQGVEVPVGGRLSSGTSAAAAQVAGVVAALRRAVPHASAGAVRRALALSAAEPAADQRHRVRFGTVRVDAALAELARHPSGGEHLATGEVGFVDPRLVALLGRTAPEARVDAVLELTDDGAAERVARGRRAVRLGIRPIVVLRDRAEAVGALLDDPALIMASAADVDRTLWLR
ncbi:hypothetical protein GCM10009836_09730 [Pseudonocardia ailaonensis]|uniref:Peptidase S8/S53 domain-containing protein n=1 Tax=Pseudonocardia ailaonensis TaxID=367279 RepID=A0ABN2MQ71_9PSEU